MPNAANRWLYRLLMMFSLGWALLVLCLSLIQATHDHLLSKSESEETGIGDDAALEAALKDYSRIARLIDCYGHFARDKARLHLMTSSHQLAAGNTKAFEGELERAQEAIEEQISCRPKDGKAWLDYSLILTERSGFDSAALNAWKQSSAVSPREAWLVEKRLLLALEFLPLLDRDALAIALRDAQTLKEALKGRRRSFLKKSELESLEELDTIFNDAVQKWEGA